MPQRSDRRRILVVTLALAAIACGAPTRTPTPTPSRTGTPAPAGPCLELVADPLPETGPAVGLRRGAGSSCERLELELVARDVTDVFAASFDLAFDPAIVRYEAVDASGSFLASDGAETQALGRAGVGRAVIGVTRWRESTGVDVEGASRLAALSFVTAGAVGTSPLRFETASLLGSDAPPRPIPAVRWVGGTIRAARR